jgi:hypothetical protein
MMELAHVGAEDELQYRREQLRQVMRIWEALGELDWTGEDFARELCRLDHKMARVFDGKNWNRWWVRSPSRTDEND